MTVGLVIVYSVTAVAFGVGIVLAFMLGSNAQTRSRSIRFGLLMCLFCAHAVTYAAQAVDYGVNTGHELQIKLRTDGHEPNRWRYILHAATHPALCAYFVLALTPDLMSAVGGAAIGLFAAVWLYAGAMAVGALTWVFALASGVCALAYIAYMFLYVPPKTAAEYDEQMNASMRQMANNSTATQRLVVRVLASLGLIAYTAFYLLDEPQFQIMPEFWSGFTFAGLDMIVVLGATLLVFAWPINAEVEPESSSGGLRLLGVDMGQQQQPMMQTYQMPDGSFVQAPVGAQFVQQQAYPTGGQMAAALLPL